MTHQLHLFTEKGKLHFGLKAVDGEKQSFIYACERSNHGGWYDDTLPFRKVSLEEMRCRRLPRWVILCIQIPGRKAAAVLDATQQSLLSSTIRQGSSAMRFVAEWTSASFGTFEKQRDEDITWDTRSRLIDFWLHVIPERCGLCGISGRQPRGYRLAVCFLC